jgi:hypothetical protein
MASASGGGVATGGAGSGLGGNGLGGTTAIITRPGGAPSSVAAAGWTSGAAGAPVAGTAQTAGTTSSCTGTLAAPSSVSVTDGSDETKISLRWSTVACAETYEVYRSTAQDGTYALLSTSNLTVYDDQSNQDSIAYYYKLRSHSAAQGYSDYTPPIKGSRKQGYVLDTSWGSSGSGDGQFSSAYGIATDATNNVYVLDTYSHRVQKFDSSGVLLTKWGGNTLSHDPGKFYYPKAIAVSASSVYVGDDLGTVQKFGLDGTYVNDFSVDISVELLDADLDASGNLYIAVNQWASSSDNLQINKYSSTYAYQSSFGSAGESDGQFSRDIHFAVDSAHSLIYVSDTGHSKIHIFTLSGTYISAWGSSGTGALQFKEPAGVAVDTDGNVYVADEGNDRISKFSLSGSVATPVATWSAPQCHAIAIDTNGRVVVLATNDAKVNVYRRR